ncbi:hypothetical protein G6F57_005884 [Rhizopus arrhizus]|nr:hypothetical protein G6F29_007371 [Rhizopus arrhizus]KAG1007333.1 hypothetical protein G6F27_007481 [Rhizopus arrhizus]KAG1025540.1 hypothetical protein G6F26_005038 [Rhizopus arrhizus]KAG1037750.1 hypothetical protein G6F25_006956 [Rhizopus arrhizus]KAG1068464.1 hypothetical protein G6F41_006820 [Rhizopus arrhizus]
MAYRSRSPDRSRSSRKRSVSPRHRKRSTSPYKSRKRSTSPYKSRKRSVSPHKSRKRRYRSPSPRHSRSVKRRSYSTDSSNGSSSSIESEDEKYKKKKREHKKHKKDRKSSKKKKKKNKLSIGENWGKYGIIYEADIFTKESEFQAWLIEVKNANVETLSNNKRKEMFIEFMEDYNTATLPHKKFYNIEKWEKRQEAIRMGEAYVPDDRFDFAKDEERLKMQHKQAARAAASRQPALQLTDEQIQELTRINRERVEADRMRKMGLKPKEGMGVRYEEVTDM